LCLFLEENTSFVFVVTIGFIKNVFQID